MRSKCYISTLNLTDAYEDINWIIGIAPSKSLSIDKNIL